MPARVASDPSQIGALSMCKQQTPTARRIAAQVAEARRVMELAARHQIAFEFTADGWRMIPAPDVEAALAPFADELTAVAS